MGDRRQAGKPSRYVTSYPDQLSLAISPRVGAMSTSKSWGVSRLASYKLGAKETEISAAYGGMELVTREGVYVC